MAQSHFRKWRYNSHTVIIYNLPHCNWFSTNNRIRTNKTFNIIARIRRQKMAKKLFVCSGAQTRDLALCFPLLHARAYKARLIAPNSIKISKHSPIVYFSQSRLVRYRDRVEQMTSLDPRPTQGVPCYGLPEQSAWTKCICQVQVNTLLLLSSVITLRLKYGIDGLITTSLYQSDLKDDIS